MCWWKPMKHFALSMLFPFMLLVSQIVQALELPRGIISVDAMPAPALQLSDMDGNSSSLASAKGKWAFVHFWASWCGPCRKEMPAIQKSIKQMQDKPLVFYIINTAEDEDTIFEFLAATAPDLNTLMDRDGLATEQWQPRGLPATYLVDPGGTIRYQALGGRDWHKSPYRDFLDKLLQQP